MTATLRFDLTAVTELVRHAENTPSRAPAFGQPDNPPPSLWLVKDDGIYVMSNGRDPQPRPDGRRFPPPVYAHGFSPDDPDVWDRARDAVGGDDFVEVIADTYTSAMLDNEIAAGARWLCVTVTDTTVEYALT